MASAVDSRLAYARLSAVATASRLPTANRGSNNSYTTSWDTTRQVEKPLIYSPKQCVRLDDTKHRLRHLSEQWADRLAFGKRLFIAKRYVEGRLNLLCELDVLCGEERHNFYIVFYRSEPTTVEGKQFGTATGNRYGPQISPITDGNEKAVFVCDVQVVDGPEKIVPSLVRFETTNDIDDIGRGAVYVSPMNHLLKVIDGPREREGDVFDLGSIQLDEVAGEQIERRPEVMNGVSHNRGQILRRLLLDPDNQCRPLRITLEDELVRVAAKKPFGARLILRDMAVGPINLHSWGMKAVHCHGAPDVAETGPEARSETR